MDDRKVTFTFSSYKVLFLLLITITSSLYGCWPVVPASKGGRDFKSSFKDELTLGRTKKEEVVNFLGEPLESKIKKINGIDHEQYVYHYELGQFPKPHVIRMLVVEFRNDIVHGYVFISSIPQDRTDFDDKNFERIEVNITKKTDIINLFGSPHGRTLLPSALAPRDRTDPDNAVEVWLYRGVVFMRKERGRPYEGDFWLKKLTIFFDANGIAIKKFATIPEGEPSGRIDRPFIAFKDATPCQDYGDLTAVLRSEAKVLQCPFTIMNNDDGKIGKLHYPATEDKIDEYITKALQASQKLLPDKELAGRTESIVKYVLSVLSKAALGKGSPLEWDGDIPEGVLDKDMYVYLPIGIGRESKHHVNARFYTLIANSQGKIIFARCIPYNPNQWSGDIEVFKRDVKGKLPLVE